jgi:hypothetical protein
MCQQLIFVEHTVKRRFRGEIFASVCKLGYDLVRAHITKLLGSCNSYNASPLLIGELVCWCGLGY